MKKICGQNQTINYLKNLYLQIALLAEKENHHPEIYNIYNIVEIRLQTHDAGNKITEKDRNLAAEIDKLI